MIKNITLLIGTCDVYSALWDNFVTMMGYHWQVSCPKIVVTENKQFEYKGYNTHSPGNLQWSDRMLSALNNINTKYVLFILEDYFLTENITQEEILFHIDFLEEVQGNKVEIGIKSTGLTYLDEKQWRGRAFYKVSPNSQYLTTIQPSIWKTDHLKKCMKKNWTPWQFEIEGTKCINGTENRTYLMPRKKTIYWNAVRRGFKLSPGWDEIKELYQLKDMDLS
jgi:hypothetical protein